MKPVSVYSSTPFDPDPLLLDLKAVAALLSVSTRTVERMTLSGEFVQPIRLNLRNNRWPRAAVERWIADRMEAAAVDADPRTALSLVPSERD